MSVSIRFRTLGLAAAAAGVYLLTSPIVPTPSPAGIGPRAATSTATAATEKPLAPDFTLLAFDGRRITLSQFRGKPVVMNFWASWCGPCRTEFPILEAAWQTYRSKDVIFLGINIEDTEAKARAFLSEFKPSYLNVRDPGDHMRTAYRVVALPMTVFLDREGRIQQRFVGAFLGEDAPKWLSTFVEELLR